MNQQNGDHQDISNHHGTRKPGAWLAADYHVYHRYVQRAADLADAQPASKLTPALLEFQRLIEGNSRVYKYFTQMFQETPGKSPYSSHLVGKPQIRDWRHMLNVLNTILTRAPKFMDTSDNVGGVGAPVAVILDHPMGTPSGHAAFLDPDVNKAIKKVLNEWGDYLLTPESANVLGDDDLGWFSPSAIHAVMNVANAPYSTSYSFEEMFVCDPTAKNHGFSCWDDYFTRQVHDLARPIASPTNDSIICNACESRAFNVAHNVKLRDSFFNKGLPYSILDMLDHSPLAHRFAAGTIYQGFLSVLSYHRWHSPVSGTIRRAFVVDGTYFSKPVLYEGGVEEQGSATEPKVNTIDSITAQSYLSALATRAVIMIEADNPKIGLMGFIGIGMDEVSSCEITVKEGQRVKKGEQLGMFHFGGSSHCLLFRKGVQLEELPPTDGQANVPVRGKLAVVRD